MKTADFSFELPPELIAQFPPEKRGESRLLILDRAKGSRQHRRVAELPEILKPGDLLVFNNSKVRKARLLGEAVQTGAGVEFLLLRKIDPCTWQAMVQRARRRRPGSRYIFRDPDGAEVASAEIIASGGCADDGYAGGSEFRTVRFDRPIDDAWLDRDGHIPLPPYIKREDAPKDADRYQTVYAAAPGSSAAPTAGLHFTPELLDRLAAVGIEKAFITLHVGLGTFLPVRTENIEDHIMHREEFSIDDETAAKIEKAKDCGRRVIAVGTTSVRTLESAWRNGRLQRGEGSTAIFIYPGYMFKVVDALFTNFHTPESTLLMLVAAFAEAKPGAFAGRELILESYAEAIREGYRFFSYGDAMLIE
jgi:S-adenosylmethionine:tRNA ribosyltransferase-isomerase